MSTLVAYFSHAGENYGTGVIAKGNTEAVAELYQIRTVKEHPQGYKRCTEAAREEQKRKARPELSGPLPDLRDYDRVFLGYPNWWGDLPMAARTAGFQGLWRLSGGFAPGRRSWRALRCGEGSAKAPGRKPGWTKAFQRSSGKEDRPRAEIRTGVQPGACPGMLLWSLRPGSGAFPSVDLPEGSIA